MPRAKRIVLFTAAISLGFASLAAAQQEGAKGVVAIRQATMDANAKHMNAIKAILTEDPLTLDDPFRLRQPLARRPLLA